MRNGPARTPRNRHPAERGSALLIAMITTLLLSTMAVAIFHIASVNSTRQVTNTRDVRLFVACESGLDRVEQVINQKVANFLGSEVETYTDSMTVGEIGVTTTVRHINSLDQTRTDADGIVSLIDVYRLDATATMVVDDAGTTWTKTVSRLLSVARTPIFQFVAFFNDDMEITAGKDMNLTGRVHTNGDLYLAPDGSTLSFASTYVRAVGDIIRRRKDDPDRQYGTVRVMDPATSTWNASTGEYDVSDWIDWGGEQDSVRDENWTTSALASFGGTVKSGVHDTAVWENPAIENKNAFVPANDSPSPGDGDWVLEADGSYTYDPANGTHEKGYYHEQAGLQIVTHGSTHQVLWKNPSTGTLEDVTSDFVAEGALVNKQTYDSREGAEITVTEIDMGVLSGTSTGSSGTTMLEQYWPSNGLIYTTRTDAVGEDTGHAPNGVRLANGGLLKQGGVGMTLVSEVPVYVKGDFNTGLQPADSSEYGDEDVAKKIPCSIMTDALNLLSNNWDDATDQSKIDNHGTEPGAAPTTYNMAYITGNQVTDPSQGRQGYNGGLENLPRFHENWGSSNPCRIRGSFVNLWESEYGTGRWYDAVYSPPTRDWNFDSDFFDFNKLPPFTPFVVGTAQSVQWEE